jgi:uncharacterized protein
MFIQLRYSLGLLLLFFVSSVWAEVAVPTLSKRVTDLTATLSIEQSTALENKIAAFEARKGSQIAVLILPTTQPEAIEAFSIRVADTWKIGRKAIDDGVILLVAKDDRKLRIEVGRGLEGVIPDAIAKRIIAEIITPKFKANDFAGGIDAGVSQLIKLIDGEALPAPSPENTATTTTQDDSLDWFFGMVLFGFILLDMFFAEWFGRFLGTVCTGLTAGLVGSGFSLFSGFGVVEAAITSVGMFVVGIIASCIFKVYSAFSGGSSGGSWSSGSSSWGGGGGGFSGGGASGSW